MNSPPHNFLAIDLGASNGRVVRGRQCDGQLNLTIIHRFNHRPADLAGHLRWDWAAILREIHIGLARAADACGTESIAAVSCSSWAQDFGLLDAAGHLFYPPVSYRDPRTRGLPQAFADIISPNDLITRVGSGCSPVTTLCQLYSMARTEPDTLARAATLLFVADLVHHDLCGNCSTDWTLATASQLRSIRHSAWDGELLASLGIPHHFLPPIQEAAQIIGRIPADNPIHPRLAGVPVISGAGHDTAAAAAALDSLAHGTHGTPGTLFLSLGTWAMLGCCVDPLVIPERAADYGWTILGLAGGRWGQWALFRAGTGLWLLQQCCRLWESQGRVIDLAQLIDQAAATASRGLINPCDLRFDAPPDMLAEIRAAARAAGLAPPETPPEFARLIFDSLAAYYARAAQELQSATRTHATTLHIIGGGSRNRLLCDLLARAANLPVSPGPAEATALGNIHVQTRTI